MPGVHLDENDLDMAFNTRDDLKRRIADLEAQCARLERALKIAQDERGKAEALMRTCRSGG